MDMTAVATGQSQVVSTQQSLVGGQQQQQAYGSDAFAMILQQMAAGMQEENAQGMDALLAAKLQMDQDSMEQSSLMGSQLLAELLGNSGFLMDYLVGNQLPEGMTQALQQLPKDAALQIQQWFNQQQSQGVPAGELFGQLMEMVKVQADAQQAMNTQRSPLIVVEQGVTDQAAPQAENKDNPAQFLNAVSEAKKALQEDGKSIENPVQAVDLEQLQRDVNAGKFNQVEASKENLMNREILSQVKTGITQNLSMGKNEFVVKLKPEGLGEITVKLVETGGKMALSIMTSNAHVASLLNNNISELQNSLRQYNTEVHEVVEQQAYAQDSGFQQSFAEQQQQRPNERRSNGMVGMDAFRLEDEEFAPETVLSSELDTYI